jgi:hypothetical protein
MYSNKVLTIFVFIIACLLPGCKNTVCEPDLTGSLIGYVYTFDEFGGILNDHSNILVTVLGAGASSANTDKNGRFEFKGLRAGTYEMNFEKPGFGSMKLFGVRHLGGTLTIPGSTNASMEDGFRKAIFLYKLPTTRIVNLTISGDSIYADFTFVQPQPVKLSIMCYFSDHPDFDKSEAQFSSLYNLENKNGVFAGDIDYDVLKQFVRPPFQTGNTVFYKAITEENSFPHCSPITIRKS